MDISGVNYDSYLAAIAQAQMLSTQQSNTQTTKTEGDKDSYIPSVASTISADMAIPSGTYSANGTELETFLPVTGVNTDSETAATQETAVSGSTGAAGGAGGAGGGSSDSDEDTETEVVTIDGVTYLQTTTTDENGNTTVTRTRIGAEPVNENEKTVNTTDKNVLN
jgi:hypothetical protein